MVATEVHVFLHELQRLTKRNRSGLAHHHPRPGASTPAAAATARHAHLDAANALLPVVALAPHHLAAVIIAPARMNAANVTMTVVTEENAMSAAAAVARMMVYVSAR